MAKSSDIGKCRSWDNRNLRCMYNTTIHNFYSCQGSVSLSFLNSEALQNTQECWKKKSQMDAIQDGARHLEMAFTVNSSNAIAISQKHYTEFARPQDLPSQVCVSELFMTCLQLCIIWFLCSSKSYNCQVARDN